MNALIKSSFCSYQPYGGIAMSAMPAMPMSKCMCFCVKSSCFTVPLVNFGEHTVSSASNPLATDYLASMYSTAGNGAFNATATGSEDAAAAAHDW